MAAASKPAKYEFQTPPLVQIALPDADIDVWAMRLDLTSDQVQLRMQLLSDDEASRAARFHFERDRRRFIVARSTLRMLLGEYLGTVPTAIKFTYGAAGKPEIAPGGGSFHFNLSHSSERALIGISSSRPLGVNIEYLHREIDHRALSERFFSHAECAALDLLPEHARKRLFFSYWTRKEAVAKACGEGLSLPFERLNVAIPPGSSSDLSATVVVREHDRVWRICATEVSDDYIAAIATTITEDL